MKFLAPTIDKRPEVLLRVLNSTRSCNTQATAALPNLSSRIQTYISRSRDPYLNLSIEHFLFEKSPPGSKILFLYTNRPCVVIGRNQNPWLEVNLRLLTPEHAAIRPSATRQHTLGSVDLVRRRSGGGTVFHDEGNVNWSVVCDVSEFTRDKHADMIVRALRKLGVDRARVNQRHDIVLDQGGMPTIVNETDMHTTGDTEKSGTPSCPLKVSGSAYKLARNRALHHGTALLNSLNLDVISSYLRSPARSFITAKGVESVPSPVGNIGICNQSFEQAVLSEFSAFYGGSATAPGLCFVGEELLGETAIADGMRELKSLDWLFLQTPQFTFHMNLWVDEDRTVPISADVRHGVFEDCYMVENPEHEGIPETGQVSWLRDRIVGKKLHEIQDKDKWNSTIVRRGVRVENENGKPEEMADFFARMFSRL